MKVKDIRVDENTFNEVKSMLGKKISRTKDKDVDKTLEITLTKLYYGNLKNIREASKGEDITENIDIYVNDIPIQIKCRRDPYIYIEDGKVRAYKKISSWQDRSKAAYTLYISPKENNILHFIEIEDSVLTSLLSTARKYVKHEKLTLDENRLFDKYTVPRYLGDDNVGYDNQGKYFKFGPF